MKTRLAFRLFTVVSLLLFAGLPQAVHAASLVVNSLLDTIGVDSNCTLREAIQNANDNAATNADCAAGSGADTITFSVSGKITLVGSQLPNITDAAGLTMDGTGQTVSISGVNGVRVLMVNALASLVLNHLTIDNGNGDISGGGGILNNGGTVTITNSTFFSNSAYFGGGIYNQGTLTVTNSTFSGNSAGQSGGGIFNSSGELTVTNSTFSGNYSTYYGGGIYISNGELAVTNSTFSSNSANNGGGGIYNQRTLNYANTILANSTSGGDCVNSGTIGTNTNNLVEDGSCAASLSGDPNLGALADNGGLTRTFALLTGSPAIEAGDDTTCGASPVNGLDQRGVARPQGAHCDIGSYEFVDTTPPTVVSSVRADPNPTTAASVHFTVTFSEPVSGVDQTDFSLTVSGLTGASVTAVSGSGATRTLSVDTGSGHGTLRLNVVDNDTILDGAGNPLGGAGAGNGNYTSGQKYTIDRDNQFRSAASRDGWVLESSETSGKGGSLAATGTLRLGDNAANKQYRSLLYFNTASLPDNATITRVTLKIRKASAAGTNPFTTHGSLLADIKKGKFGASPLQIGDFQATASKANVGHFTKVGGSTVWYQLVLGAANYQYINKAGVTQFRLRFTKDDNNDRGADFASFYAGNATTASNRPLLIVEYTLP